MPEFTRIIRTLSEDKFLEVFSVSNRKAREAYLLRHSIRKPKSLTGFNRAGAAGHDRAVALFELLKEQEDDQLAEEILRTWLLTKRPMLAAALDFLQIPHDNGLTDSDDVSKFEKLPAEDLRRLVQKLSEISPKDEVAIYLKFMGAPSVDEALSAA